MHWIYSEEWKADLKTSKSPKPCGWRNKNGVVITYSESGSNNFGTLEQALAKIPNLVLVEDLMKQ